MLEVTRPDKAASRGSQVDLDGIGGRTIGAQEHGVRFVEESRRSAAFDAAGSHRHSAGSAESLPTDQIAAQLHSFGVAGETARSLATTTVAAVEGAVVLAVASRSVQPLDDVGHHLSELARLHMP
jgi:hypothetical protein